jgi:four helix bundle protein
MFNYRNMQVWQRAHQLTLAVYRSTKSWPREELYGLTSQVRRAATSVPANVAEGTGRFGKAELRRFLQIALGSACELDYLLLLAKDLEYLPTQQQSQMAAELTEIRKMLVALIQRLTSNV